MMKADRTMWLSLTIALLVLLPTAVKAEHPCSSPLILDLDGDGIRTTHYRNYPVLFDIDADGDLEQVGWTFWESEEAFLWLDLNHNGVVDDGGELFGDSTLLPQGGLAANGFEALAAFDSEKNGGDGDGRITHRDLVWPSLRLWIDRNHDGVSQPTEVGPLSRYGVVAISLEYHEIFEFDGNLNLHLLRGSFLKRSTLFGRAVLNEQRVDDIWFQRSP